LFFINLFLLILTGTLMLGWVLYFTDLFPVIGGLLGLGGLFAWIAFLGNVVSDDRKKELQSLFEKNCLQRLWFLVAILCVVVAFAILVPAKHGTIVINNAQHDRPRTVAIQPVDDADGANSLVVPARGEARHVVTTGIFGTRSFRVKAEGLPWLDRQVSWFDRQPVEITGDFRRRHIVLIRPHAEKLRIFGNVSRTLRVTISGGCQTPDQALYAHAGYRGGTAWLGAAADVDPTTDLTLDWRLELERAKIDNFQRYRAMWSRPVSLSDDAVTAGTTISACVTRDDNSAEIVSGQVTLPDPLTGPTIIEVIMR